jgi:glycerophosphoryl diester phosphodiesterase
MFFEMLLKKINSISASNITIYIETKTPKKMQKKIHQLPITFQKNVKKKQKNIKNSKILKK